MMFTLCLVAHLWSMNLASAAPLFAVWLNRRNASATTLAVAVRRCEARHIAVTGVMAFVIGMLLGGLLGGIMWWNGDHTLFDVLPRFSHKITWGIGELVFYMACMLLFLYLQSRDFRGSRGIQAALAVLASTNLLYHFPPLFSVMSLAADAPDSISAHVNASEFRSLMMRGHVAAFSVHFGLASFAVTGIELLHRCASRISSANLEAEEAEQYQRIGRTSALVALVVTGIQMLVGVWLMTRMSALTQHQILGGDAASTGLFGASILATFWLLHLLAGIVFGNVNIRQTRFTQILLFAIVIMMTGVLVRSA